MNPASWAGCCPRPNCAVGPALRQPAKPAHSEMEFGPTWPSRRTERVRTAPARMERAGRCGYRGVTGSRGTPASLRRARPPPRALAGHLHDGGELARRRGVGSVYGLTSGEVGLRDTMLPSLPVRREMTGGVGHSRQRRELDKGAGCEALTGDGRRSGQSSGGVAVLSFSWCSCARRRVRRWEGAATAVNQRGKQRMEELTGVVRLMEMEQR
jgi:hypothetical protein